MKVLYYARVSHAAGYVPCARQAPGLPLPDAAGKGFALGLLEDPCTPGRAHLLSPV